jgi:hypothetical protein
VIAALYVQNRPFVFIALGERPEIQLYWGAPERAEVLSSLLAANLPGARFDEASGAERLRDLSKLRRRAFMTGIPTSKSDQIERLLRGLMAPADVSPLDPEGAPRWAYLVLARPVEMSQIAATLETLADEIRRVKNTHLRKDSVEEQNHPLAQYYVDLLHTALDKYKEARLRGAWDVRTVFFAGAEPTLRRGMALLTATFAGEDSRPRPICVQEGILATAGEPELLPSTVLNTADVTILVRPPRKEFPGFAVGTAGEFGLALPANSPEARAEAEAEAETDSESANENRPGLAIGRVIEGKSRRATGQWMELDARHLVKHAFITGVTGSGKTETCLFLLDQLWREQGIPFLVIEPVKREYRGLARVQGYDGLQIFTPGEGEGEGEERPFQLNPFEVPQGIHVQAHIDLLRSLFHASFAGLYAPMPYLLEEALYELYEERGWDLTGGERPKTVTVTETETETETETNSNSTDNFPTRTPTLTDLAAKVEEVVGRAGYDSEVTQNVATALRVRLNSLRIGAKGRMLDVRSSLSLEELLERPAILELAALGDPETVAFLMGLLWMRLYEHRLARGNGPLQHVTLLEEAHRLLARSNTSTHPEAAQTREKAMETFSNMLLEMRSFGEGLLIVDQSPTKLHSDVLKGTNLKIVHRLVAEEDRRAIGGCTNMNDAQERALATLSVGQAAVYAEGLESPILVRVPPFRRYAFPEVPR